MANTAFTNRKIKIPITVPNGGTGRTSLTNKAVIVGADTGDVNFVLPGSSGNALTSDGLNWVSGVVSPSDGSVTYAKLNGDLVNSGEILSLDIDWSLGSIFTKTLDSNTIFTFSNYQLNKVITLVVEGNYALGFSSAVKIINGIYDGTKTNYITLHCTKSTAPQEVWVVINQGL